jgi:hypothetical protein
MVVVRLDDVVVFVVTIVVAVANGHCGQDAQNH